VGLVDFQDYHGTWAVWTKETFEVVRGLERQGLHHLARQLANRVLNGVNAAGADVEFLYVSPDGRVGYDFRDADRRDGAPFEIAGTNRPEAPQAWTVTAVLALKSWYGRGLVLHRHMAGGSRQSLDREACSAIEHVEVYSTRAQARAAYERRGDFVLNLERGQKKDRRARATRRGREVVEA
jgi:hypothetical protein